MTCKILRVALNTGEESMNVISLPFTLGPACSVSEVVSVQDYLKGIN